MVLFTAQLLGPRKNNTSSVNWGRAKTTVSGSTGRL